MEQEAGESEILIYCSKETKQNVPWRFITGENHLKYFWLNRKFTSQIGHRESVNNWDRFLKWMVCIIQMVLCLSCNSFAQSLVLDRLTTHQALKCLQKANAAHLKWPGRTHYTSLSQISWHLHSSFTWGKAGHGHIMQTHIITLTAYH